MAAETVLQKHPARHTTHSPASTASRKVRLSSSYSWKASVQLPGHPLSILLQNLRVTKFEQTKQVPMNEEALTLSSRDNWR
jgi:hypothetical protein